MSKELNLTREMLLKSHYYNPKTGLLYKRWSYGLKETGSNNKGYLKCRINGFDYLVHRLACLYMTGEWPEGEVDHIDGDPSNNAWNNLRVGSKSDNMENRKNAKKHNLSTGLLGAFSNGKPNGKFVAKITAQGKPKHLGTFDTPEEAHQAYVEAKRQLHSFNTL